MRSKIRIPYRAINPEKEKKNGKLPASHRYDLIPLLRSRPGGFKGSWLCRTCRCKNTTLLELNKLFFVTFYFDPILMLRIHFIIYIC